MWLVILLFTGLSHSNKVDQSPSDVIKKQGESAVIRCLHSVPNYNQINWYKQNQGQEFTFMGYLLLIGPNLEKEFTEKIEMSGNGNSNGSVTIKNLAPSDSAVYFCAAYYTVFYIPAVLYKNLSLILLLEEEAKKHKCLISSFTPAPVAFTVFENQPVFYENS